MRIRLLTPADAGAYVALRREMLADVPWAFASSPEDDVGLDAGVMGAKLAEPGQAIVGAWDDAGRLAGAAGLYRDRHVKMAHRARVWGVYVTPGERGHGVAKAIMSRVFETAGAWAGVTSLGLSASERSTEAISLYQRIGFRAWGREPGALMLDGSAYDEIHMVASLVGAVASVLRP